MQLLSPARRRLLVAGLVALCLLPATLWLPRLSLALPDFLADRRKKAERHWPSIPWFAIWLERGGGAWVLSNRFYWVRLRRLIARSAPPDARLESTRRHRAAD
ncbi:MAG: hypothetical protein R3F11_11785 [Verrucomicrobiales bacterium]